MENQKNNMSEKTNSVDFENPVKMEEKKTIKIFGKEIKKSTVKKVFTGVVVVGGAGFLAHRQYKRGYNAGWKTGYNTGCAVTTILERTPKSRLEEVGNKIGVNADKHMEISNKLWGEQGPKLLGGNKW